MPEWLALALDATLDRVGGGYSEFTESGEFRAVRLEVCPACGGRQRSGGIETWKSWVTYTGNLKCWRSSCPAGGERGMLLGSWTRKFVPEAIPVVWEATDLLPADAAVVSLDTFRDGAGRQLLDKMIRQARKSVDRVAVFVAPTGSGKSTLVADRLAGEVKSGSTCVYSAGTHQELEEFAALLRARQVPTFHLVGAERGCCDRARREHGTRIGWPLFWKRVVCPGCPMRQSCPAWQDPPPVDAAHVRLITHASLPRAASEGWLVGLVVIDEHPPGVNVSQATPASLRRVVRVARLHPRLHRLHELLSVLLDAFDDAVASGTEEKVCHGEQLERLLSRRAEERGVTKEARLETNVADLDFLQPEATEILSGKRSSADVIPPSVLAIANAVQAILSGNSATGLGIAPPGRWAGSGRIMLADPRPLPTLRATRRGTRSAMIVLSATGHIELPVLRACNPERKVRAFALGVKAAAGSDVHRIWLASGRGTLSRSKMLDSSQRIRRGRRQQALRIFETFARACSDYLRSTRASVLLPKPLYDRYLAPTAPKPGNPLRRALCALDSRYLAGYPGLHHRGTNQFTDRNASLIIGDHWPNIVAATLAAQRLGIPVNDYLAIHAKAEITQCLGRVRAEQSGEDCVLVVAGSVLPPGWVPGENCEVVTASQGRPPRSQRELLWDTVRTAFERYGCVIVSALPSLLHPSTDHGRRAPVVALARLLGVPRGTVADWLAMVREELGLVAHGSNRHRVWAPATTRGTKLEQLVRRAEQSIFASD